MRFTIEHRFDIDLATFERHLNDPALLARFAGVPGLAHRDLLEANNRGGLRSWRFRVRADEDVPPAARAVLRPELLTWVEESSYDPAARTIAWRIVPDHFRAYAEAHGIATLAPDGDRRVRRTIEGEVRVRVPLLGARIEAMIVERLRRSYDAVARAEADFFRGIA
jgi:hypothetical protein